MGEGGGFGGGIRFTTADSVPGGRVRGHRHQDLKGYRQFQGDVIVGKLGNEGTHLDASFRYRRRTKDNFFGIGPKVGPESPVLVPPGVVILPTSSEFFETNFDTEERRTSAALYHDFTDRFQAGVYVAYRSTSSYEGKEDADTPIGTFFSPQGINFCGLGHAGRHPDVLQPQRRAGPLRGLEDPHRGRLRRVRRPGQRGRPDQGLLLLRQAREPRRPR